MQNSPATNLPSPSSTHPINGTLQSQRLHNETHGIIANPTPGSPLPPPPARNAKRLNNSSTTKPSQTAAQLAKHEILSKLREDWSWPPVAGTPCSHQAVNFPEEENGAWREREGGFDTESDSAVDPYQYEDPDAVVQPEESRKRKREMVLREEMGWNAGLRCFVERRDVWSGARVQRDSTGYVDIARKQSAIYAPPAASAVATPIFERPSPPNAAPPAEALPSTLVPLAPPILPPTNAVRASITPATYPSIYSKIVIQGLSPTVPINLSDVVGALVQGWKNNDEWPPKSEAEKAGEMDGGGVGGGGGLEGIGEVGAIGVRNGVRRGMGKVKKALGLLGGADGNEGVREVGVNEGVNDLRGFDARYD